MQSLIDIYFPESNLRVVWNAHFDAIEAAFTAFSIAPDLAPVVARLRDTAGVDTEQMDTVLRAKRYHLDLVKDYVGPAALPDSGWEALRGGSTIDFAYTAAWVNIREALVRKHDAFAGYVRSAKLLDL